MLQYAEVFNSTCSFLPIDSGVFVTMSEEPNGAALMYHPIANPFAFSTEGVDFNCVSQLNTSVANSWKGNWMTNNP